MNINEMRAALSKLEQLRRDRDKVAAMYAWSMDEQRTKDIQKITAIIADVWVFVPLDITQKLYKLEYDRQEQTCIELALSLGVDHAEYKPEED